MTAGGFNYQYETAVLAFGCFWRMQDLIDPQRDGVLSIRVGYTGGDLCSR